jgi:hypothetical protein
LQSQTVTENGNTIYHVKGTSSVSNVPAGFVEITHKIQKKVGNQWVTVITTVSNVRVRNGSASYDCGWHNITPLAGEEWRLLANAKYIDPNTQLEVEIPGIGSIPIVPIP